MPHGTAAALTLPAVLLANRDVSEADCTDPRGILHVRRMIDDVCEVFGESSVEGVAQQIVQLLRKIGCPCSLSEAGVKQEADLRALAEGVNAERLANNPRKLDGHTVLQLLRNAA